MGNQAMTRGKYTRKPGNPYGRKPDAEQDAATLQAIADLLELGQSPTPQAVRNVLAQRGVEKSRSAVARRMDRLRREGRL
jgi:hypothetical protein